VLTPNAKASKSMFLFICEMVKLFSLCKYETNIAIYLKCMAEVG
jgi:hypothetical protein